MSDPVVRLNAALEGRYAIEREVGEGAGGVALRAGHVVAEVEATVRVHAVRVHAQSFSLKRGVS